LEFPLHKYFSTKHGDSHNYYGTIVAHRPNSLNYTIRLGCFRDNECVKVRSGDIETLLPDQVHEPKVDEKAMEEEVVEWIQNDAKEKDDAEFMSEREFCDLTRDQLKTAKYFQHKFSNKDDPINWTILGGDEDITDCSAFKTVVQKYEEEGAKLDPDLIEAMGSKKAHEVFFEFVSPELKGVAARMDKYYEDPRAEYYTTVHDRSIKFHDPTAEDPDWKIKNNILLILAAANESASGVDGLWKSGKSDLFRTNEPDFGKYCGENEFKAFAAAIPYMFCEESLWYIDKRDKPWELFMPFVKHWNAKQRDCWK
jgi:hypothetical protein